MKGNFCSKLKKGKLKTKKLLKITIGILEEQEHSVQSAEQVGSWKNMLFTKTWKVAVTASISEN